MPYLDSNVFIYPVIYQESEPKAKKAKEILLQVESGELDAYTSALTWNEVVWVVSKAMGRSEGISQGKKLLGFPNLKFIAADLSVVSRAQRLSEKRKINPRDAVQVASALEKKLPKLLATIQSLMWSKR